MRLLSKTGAEERKSFANILLKYIATDAVASWMGHFKQILNKRHEREPAKQKHSQAAFA